MADRIIFVCILLLAGIYFWATSQIPTLEIGDPLGPKAFPRLLGVGLLITAAMLLFEIIAARKSDQTPARAAEPSTEQEQGHMGVVVGAVAITAVFFLLFETLGYVIATSLYLLAMTHLFHKKGRWRVNVLTSLTYGVGSYLIFTHALGVNLPRGILPF